MNRTGTALSARPRRSLPHLLHAGVATVVLSLTLVLFGGSGVVANVGSAAADPAPPSTSSPQVTNPPTECVGSSFATLGGIYDAIFDSLLPQMPEQVQRDATSIKAAAHRDMDGVRVSSLAISNHPKALGASDDSPSLEYRDPLSQYVLTQLMNIRNGTEFEAITLENMTLSQAVETVYFYLYITVIIPATLVAGTIPPIMPIGPVSLGMLISLPLRIGTMAIDMIKSALSEALIDACIVSVTKEQKDSAGQPVKDLRFPNQVPQILTNIAGQVLIAEDKTCPSVGSQPLSRVVERTSHYLQDTTDASTSAQVADQTARLQDFMSRAQVPHNLIPADPADFDTIETLMALGLGFVPYVGGAPTQALTGLVSNILDGADMSQTVPLADLTVTKSMTSAYYAYALSTHVFTLAYNESDDLTVSLLQMLLPSLSPEQLTQLIPSPGSLINAPNTYGLIVYHNVLRSVCLAEDNTAAPAT